MHEHSANRILTALQNESTYGHAVEDIQVIQTHISWVILAGDYAYKLKKPVDFGFLDFSTLRKRRYYCHQEVELNCRLCADTYLGVVPIRDDGGTLHLGGRRGRIVEYAVKMRRLPHGRMLDHLLEAGRATPEMIDEVATTLADFHNRAESGQQIARYGSPHAVKRNWDENFEQTREFVGATILPFQYEFLKNWVSAWLKRHRRLLKDRQREGRVRDGHGDLRASAVCVEDRLCIFDCIEFNRRFRYADVAADIAFLAMDLEARDRPDLAERFIDGYVAGSGDAGIHAVIHFYMCYRAYVRGKVETLRAVDRHVPLDQQEEARNIATKRFNLAVDLAARANTPVLIITCGLSGSGKSAIADGLARQLPFEVVASDRVRKDLAGVDATERRSSEYQSGIYTSAFTRRTYRELLRRGRERLGAGESVILDATFSKHEWRQRARKLAEDSGALFFCLECRVDEPEIRARLETRSRQPDLVSDATWETYLAQREAFEPVRELDEWRHVVVSTHGELHEAVARAVGLVGERLRPVGPRHD